MSSLYFFFDGPEKSSGFKLVNFYENILAVIVLSVAYLDLANYYYVLTVGVPPKYTYFALAGLIVPLFFVRYRSFIYYLSTPYVLWMLAFLCLNFLHWIFNSIEGLSDLADLTLMRIQYLILAALLGFLLFQVRPAVLGKIFFVLSITLALLQLFDFFMPGIIVPAGTEGAVAGRASSTLVNANKAGESLVLLLILGMSMLQPRWRIWLFFIVAPGVFLTFSRSGLLALLLVLVGGFWQKIFSRSAYAVLISLVFFTTTAVGLLDFILSYVDISSFNNVYDRLMFFSTLETSDSSAAERFMIAEYAFDSFLNFPLFGNGSGYTYFWGVSDQAPHNQHLLVLSEYGMVGYLLFGWLVVLMFRGMGYFKYVNCSKMGVIIFLVFLIFTLFTHNMFDSLYWLLTFSVLSHRAMYFNK